MSADFAAIGPEAHVNIDGNPFAAVSGQYRMMGDEADTSDTESGKYKRLRVGLQQFELECEANMQGDVDYYPVTGLNLSPDTIHTVFFYPYGNADPAAPSTFPGTPTTKYVSTDRFRIIGSEGNFQVQGSAPQHIRLRGKTDGAFVSTI